MGKYITKEFNLAAFKPKVSKSKEFLGIVESVENKILDIEAEHKIQQAIAIQSRQPGPDTDSVRQVGISSIKKYKSIEDHKNSMDTLFFTKLEEYLIDFFTNFAEKIANNNSQENSPMRKIPNMSDRPKYIREVVTLSIKYLVNFSNPIPEICQSLDLISNRAAFAVTNDKSQITDCIHYYGNSEDGKAEVLPQQLFDIVEDIVIKKLKLIANSEKEQAMKSQFDDSRNLHAIPIKKAAPSLFKMLTGYNSARIRNLIDLTNDTRREVGEEPFKLSDDVLFETSADLAMEFLLVVELFNTLCLFNDSSRDALKKLIYMNVKPTE